MVRIQDKVFRRACLWILVSLCLTGCAQRFDCPYKEGVRCTRLSEVDQKIKTGKSNQPTSTKPLKSLSPQPMPGSPLRSSEEVLTVWIAPYRTSDGTYHEEKRLHFVARPAEWKDTLDEINDKD